MFSPPWWAKSPHIQTILPSLMKVLRPLLKRERLELPDQDFIDLDWLSKPIDNQPIILMFHGVEGSADSHYIKRLLSKCKSINQCALVHHYRGCSGEINRLPRAYHSGDTQDVQISLEHIKAHFPHNPIYAVGYSLGGNILTKYLGEHKDNSLIERAVVIAAPLQLAACAKKLEKGFSKIYQSYFIKRLQKKIIDKMKIMALDKHIPITQHQIKNLTTLHRFDHQVTAPLHGFDGVDDYYRQASGLPFLAHIAKPTLVIHAKDDPFMTEDVIPSSSQLSPHVSYELHNQGGHLGFIEGGSPWNPKYYLERRILEYLLPFSSATQRDRTSASPIRCSTPIPQ
ncbi:hydrolase [Shewanella surugensis]|uniref:Hydrolase n=1 Tax=Shewanella surugensis TaxID=212020 RepID=A0ABT0LKH3_9GAMM|nr:hydrolase [Shewanella surugensis]MCL1127656.1 hydrolase [Shewanella surugensis]